MDLVTAGIAQGSPVTAGLFGGNVLASHGGLNDSAYDQVIDALGVTTLRFPGGSLTERLFDIRDPDSPSIFDPEAGGDVDMMSLTEFMVFAEVNDHPVTIVIPTRTQLGTETDANGDRLPQIDAQALQTFVQDVASGQYGNAQVQAFEIGNEYWGSGEMNAAEYGRLAAEMSVIVDDALAQIGGQDIDVVVQKGSNFAFSELSQHYVGVSVEDTLADLNATYGLTLDEAAIYATADVNWTYVNNQIILENFDTVEERDAIDGVVAHVYSMGADRPFTRTFDLNNINDTWREEMPDLDVYVTEWNLRSTQNLSRDEDYGLFQAHEMLNLMEEFIRADVTQANVWPLIQNTSNALSEGMAFEEPTVSGEMFALMAETLPGKTLLDFTPTEGATTELEMDNVAVHGFAGEGELALYIFNTSHTETTMADIDFSGLVASFGDGDAIRIGVRAGDAPGSNNADAQVDQLDAEAIIDDGVLMADLLPGEIIQVVLSDIVPTEAFRPTWDNANLGEDAPLVPVDDDRADNGGSGENDVPDDSVIPTVPETLILDESESGDPEGADDLWADEGSDGLVFGLALLPLLALLGFAAG